MNLNRVALIGNLTRDPEAKKTSSGQDISSFSLATNYVWKDQKTKKRKELADFHRIIAWGKLAGVINKYLKKGSRIYLEGRLHNRSWQDGDQKKSMTEIVAQNMIMLSSKASPKTQNDLAAEDIDVEEIPVDKD